MDSSEIDFVDKPLYFHSAASIYVLLTYPERRIKNSFINLVETKDVPCVLKLALDILGDDIDGINFI